MTAADSSFKADGVPMRRFWLNRIKDETGISRTGRVVEGVVCQNGQVIIQWRPPLTSIAIYPSLEVFMKIHVECHPSCNEIVFLDGDVPCKGHNGPACSLCGGSGATFSSEEARVIKA